MEGMACCDGYLPKFQLTRWPSCGDFSAYIWDTDDSPCSPYLWAPSVTLSGAGNQPLSKYGRGPVHFYHARLCRCLGGLYHHHAEPHMLLIYLAAHLPRILLHLSGCVGEEWYFSQSYLWREAEACFLHVGSGSLRYLHSSAMFRNPLDIFPQQRALDRSRSCSTAEEKWRE